MKWQKTTDGSERVISRFALLPVKMDETDTVVWLEKYYILQRYTSGTGWYLVAAAECWSLLPGGWVLQRGKIRKTGA